MTNLPKHSQPIGRHLRSMRGRLGVLLCLVLTVLPLVGTSLWSNATIRQRNKVLIRPTIPLANRNQANRVFIDHADRLFKNQIDTFMVLTGNVEFVKGGMHMFCDSAHFYESSESLDAFGNVRMRQGDTLFVYADEMQYDGINEYAYLFANPGKKVKMINRDVTLRTDVFTYDLLSEVGYYENGGELTDAKNRLTSIYGEYLPSTKEANFRDKVHLSSHAAKDPADSLDIFTDTLYYNVRTHIAEIYAHYDDPLRQPAKIINRHGTIYTREAVYDTDLDTAILFDQSVVVSTKGAILSADTLFYDSDLGYGEGFSNMVLVDTVKKMTLMGDYGYYNEKIDSAFVTGRALALEYSKDDTLFIHGRRIYSFLRVDSIFVEADSINNTPETWQCDSSHVVVATPRVRFFRSDMQGVCDSLRYEEADSTIHLHIHPIIWNGEQQIFGNLIQLHLNDSTIDRANLPDFGFTAQHVEDELYNQLSGKEMTAWFEDGEIQRLEVNGNVEVILLPEENDSTINKIVNAESSFLTSEFENQYVSKLKMWPETGGTVTPLFLAKKSMFKLSKFQWYEVIRPKDKDDIFNIPPEMDELMGGEPSPSNIKPSIPAPESMEMAESNSESNLQNEAQNEDSDNDNSPTETTEPKPEAVATDQTQSNETDETDENREEEHTL